METKNIVFALIGLVVLFFIVSIWKLSNTMDIPFSILGKTFLGLLGVVIFAVLLGYGKYQLDLGFTKWVLPILVISIPWACKPTLSYVAGKRENLPFDMDVAFYGTNWFYWLITALILTVGYGWLYKRSQSRW